MTTEAETNAVLVTKTQSWYGKGRGWWWEHVCLVGGVVVRLIFMIKLRWETGRQVWWWSEKSTGTKWFNGRVSGLELQTHGWVLSILRQKQAF